VIDYLHDAIRSARKVDAEWTLEKALAEYASMAGRNTEINSHLAATRYYVRDLLWACTDYVRLAPSTPMTLYTSLVRQCYEHAARVGRELVLVSFNYDLLLDYARASYWGLDPMNLASYVRADAGAALVKPHGSVHWAWPVSTMGPVRGHLSAIERAVVSRGPSDDELVTTSTQVVKTAPHVRNEVAGAFFEPTQPTIPAIALPIVNKSTFAWPAAQLQRFQSLVGRVSHVLTIGWRAAEPHFVDLLIPTLADHARLRVVTGGDHEVATAEAIRIMQTLEERATNPIQAGTYAGGFENLVLDHLVDEFLSG
jgi:hypothetical protein